MTVYRLYMNQPFEPEAVAMMTNACTEVCQALGLHDRDDREVDTVAKTVIEYAQRGVRDPVRLRERVLEALRPL